MNIVLLPPEQAESMNTYVDFTKETSKPCFHYRLADFVAEQAGEPAHFKVDANDYIFDPDKLTDEAED